MLYKKPKSLTLPYGICFASLWVPAMQENRKRLWAQLPAVKNPHKPPTPSSPYIFPPKSS